MDATTTTQGADGSGLTEAGGDGDHLTAINLPNQTMDIVGNITGNLSGSVGSLTGHTVQTADHTAGIAANQTDLNTIIADTNELQTDNIPGTLATIQTSTDRLTAVRAAVLTDLIDGGRLDALIDLILGDTAELQSDNIPGTLSTIQTSTDRLTAVRAAVLTDWIDAGRLDLLLDAVLQDTGTTLQAELDGIQADTEDIQSRIPTSLSSGRMRGDMEAISSDVTGADKLEALMEGTLVFQVNGGSPSTTTMVVDGDVDDNTDDHYIGRLITGRTGANAGQQTAVTDWDGSTRLLTFDALTGASANDDFWVMT